ncbi:hypothetical protein ASD52_11020 [Ensifer sp. Root142]|nr:hypothetical protein ASD52_11020 [Ensifer sp. Root142]
MDADTGQRVNVVAISGGKVGLNSAAEWSAAFDDRSKAFNQSGALSPRRPIWANKTLLLAAVAEFEQTVAAIRIEDRRQHSADLFGPKTARELWSTSLY